MSSLLVITVTLSLIYSCILLFRRYKFAQKLNKIPGLPPSIFGFGIRSSLTLVRMFASGANKVPERLASFAQSMPSLFPNGMTRIWVGPLAVVIMTKPEMIQSFMNNNKNEIRKGIFYKFLKPFLGNGLITSHGEQWRLHRKLLTPAFHFKILEHAIPVMNKQADVLVSSLDAGRRQDKDGIIPSVSQYIMLCSLDIISESAMGQEMHSQSKSESDFVQANRFLSHAFSCRTSSPLLGIDFFFNRSSLGGTFYKKVNTVLSIIDNVINVKQKELDEKAVSHDIKSNVDTDKPPAFLDILMRHHQETPDQVTRDDVRDQIMNFISAGYETTGWSLTWAIFQLSLDQEIQERIHEEVDQEFADSHDLSFDQLKNSLPYTEAVVKETMRMYPGVPVFSRQLDQDIEINGYEIPASTNVVINAAALHRDPEHWRDPDRFIPDRFLSDRGGNQHHPFAYIPFSAGARNCIGQRFAILELKLLIAKICHRFIITNMDAGRVVTRIAITMATESNIRVKLEPRKAYEKLV